MIWNEEIQEIFKTMYKYEYCTGKINRKVSLNLDEEIVFVRTIARFLGISVDDAKEIIKKERKKQNGLE